MIRSTTIFAGAFVVALGSYAPLQCGHKTKDSEARVQDGGDALWDLAMDFRAQGNEAAAKRTLQKLVQRYPSNRHVPQAKEELGGAVEPAPPDASAEAPSRSSADAAK